VTPITLVLTATPRVSRSNPHPRRTAMRHLSAARDVLVPIAGIAFFAMLFTLVA
jgi:hypothetical protein